jgi:hypothetical protein
MSNLLTGALGVNACATRVKRCIFGISVVN